MPPAFAYSGSNDKFDRGYKNLFQEVTGRIIGADGKPLSGVSVTVKGTSRGTTTDANGAFSINANRGEVLVVSYVGYQAQEFTVGDDKTLAITLTATSGQLSEVVVTALGVRRERKALGYSVTEVKGEELTRAREVNVVNSLAGRVAGLNVNGVAGGPGSSSNLIIRGISSISGTNQPLYVVNGVPMEGQPNSQYSQQGTQFDNGPDRGDAIGNLNPDDIETISVLKGAAASALYGYRAKAGVIMITTKSGRGDGIEFNSNYVAETIIDPTDWQYVYGQGANNIKPPNQAAAFTSGQSSYGGKLDGSSVVQFDGISRPYIAQKDNLENFYRTGGSFTNTLAFNKSFTGGALRFSASNLSNNAVIPNSGLDRQNFSLNGNFSPMNNLTIDVRMNYIIENAKNRPFLSDGPGNANFNVMFLPTSVNVNDLQPATTPDGKERSYSDNTFATNPWFAAYNFITNTKRDRLLSTATVRYTFNNGLFLQGRAGRDAYTDRYTQVVPTGTAYRPNGSINEQTYQFGDINVDGLAGMTFNLGGNGMTLTPNIGASYRRTKDENITNTGSDFAIPFLYNINNTKSKGTTALKTDQEVQSLYGTLEFDIRDFLYLTGSVRSDWFSTLAAIDRDNKLNVVYPSVSASFIFSEFLKLPWMTFGKLRAGYAEVGQATTPYQTALYYSLLSPTLNGAPLGNIVNPNVPNNELKPSRAQEFEIGTELRFFNNRLGLDLTFYDKRSKDEIVFAPASTTSGYNGAVLNIGEMKNVGFEALITGTPIRTGDFNWTTSLNGSVNDNEVIKLAAGQSSLPISVSRSGVGFTRHVVGEPAVQVMAYDYKYDASGKVVLDANGIPARGDLVPFGSAYHKWIAGWNNEITYKRANLSFLIDGKWGGKIFSATDFYGYLFGLHKATLENREGTFGTANVNAATYYGTIASNISKTFVNDASFIKLRQITLGYSFPSLFNNHIKGLNISLVARNLAILMKKTDNIDPEGNFTPLAQGLELGGVPPVRSYGINLNVRL
ncbi:membrane protein [Flavisolibacter tropicus]|uniref:Membrane protein n=1 Tax=Flavisolibacter tropicus TaxID=1492898 RepID=A0A172U2K7_9BACT|nr:membrane protein [Flavisolibacter tropicus]